MTEWKPRPRYIHTVRPHNPHKWDGHFGNPINPGHGNIRRRYILRRTDVRYGSVKDYQNAQLGIFDDQQAAVDAANALERLPSLRIETLWTIYIDGQWHKIWPTPLIKNSKDDPE